METKYEPWYWLNDNSVKTLKAGYLLEGEEPLDRYKDIAQNAQDVLWGMYRDQHGYEKDDGYIPEEIMTFADKFYDYLSRGWFSLASPVLANFGRDRGLPVSCFNSHISDSCNSILFGLSEVGKMTQMGGGTSAYFGDLRPRGSSISKGGESEGVVHLLKMYESVANVMKQSSVRRGAIAVYLPIDHGDFDEFIEIRSDGNPLQDIFTGVVVDDWWMEEMIAGDKEKRKKWGKVIKARNNTGIPYIFFRDNANKNAPKVYKDKGRIVNSGNLCVTGDQRVPTNRGLLKVRDLYEQGGDLKLFDNEKIVNSSPMTLISSDSEVYEIELENGMKHKVTPDHMVSVAIKTNKSRERWENFGDVKCSDLKIGDRVKIQTNSSGLFGSREMKQEAFLLGMYQSDGTQHKDIIFLDVWENDFDLLEEMQDSFNTIHYRYGCDTYKNGNGGIRNIEPAKFHECKVNQSTVRKRRLGSKTLKKALNFEKGYVPEWIWESDEDSQWEYVRGLLYADGTVHVSSINGNPIQIGYADINRDFLVELQLLFVNLGMQASIRLLKEGGDTLLPDGKGGHKYYKTKDCYRLIVGNKNDALKLEEKTGFLSRKNIKLEDRVYRNNTKKTYKVKSITKVENEEVFCVKVDSDEHHWICNGIVTHNCNEIALSSTEDESFVCVLSSLNILHFDEWKDTDAPKILSMFLDAVNEEFINKAEDLPYMHRAVKFARNQRALGLGVLGWHSYLQSNRIPFGSLNAMSKTHEVFSFIEQSTDEINKQMSDWFGEPELLEGYSLRNTTTTAIAPTKSSSAILGGVSQGIEPIHSNYFIDSKAKTESVYKNPDLIEALNLYDKNTPEIWDSILDNGGSVQHLDFLTDNEKEVFRTFMEISQMDVIKQASERQKYIQQGQSLNLMIHPDMPVKDENGLYIEAWKSGVIGLYYRKSENSSVQFARNLVECSACGG